MQTYIHAIVLRSVKHSDSNNVITVFSRENGRFSFLSPAGTTREAIRRRALLMPFCEIEGIADFRLAKDLAKMKEIVRGNGFLPPYNPIKGIISMFLAEILDACLREQQTDHNLYDFILQASRLLNDENDNTAIANFHIVFLLRLLALLGVEPDYSTYKPGSIFDINDGVWRQSKPLNHNSLSPDESLIAANLFRKLTFRNSRLFKFNRDQRNQITDTLIQYLSLHVANLSGIKSLDVVRNIFS